MSDYVYHNWPIRLAWVFNWRAWSTWFTWHGIQGSGRHYYWVYHLGPLKLVFGERTANMYHDHFEDGLKAGLGFDGFTREWMKRERGMRNNLLQETRRYEK